TVSELFILRRVNAVLGAARLAAGDLTARASVTGVDEIGAMAQTFNVLNQMGELFQTCLTLKQAYGVIAQLAPRLFPTEAGAVFALSPDRRMSEAVAQWGPHPVGGTTFAAQDCWALRHGRSHLIEDTTAGVLCRPLPSPPPQSYLCTPLVAQEHSFG